jgi:hypothetical protein
MTMEQDRYEFGFDVDPRFRQLLLVLGVNSRTARVEIGRAQGLVARFGLVQVRTSLDNIAGAELTGPYRWYTAIGVRESWADHGLTFGSTTSGGVCIRFHTPVRGLGWGARHPGLTVTVKDRELFRDTVRRLIGDHTP